MFVIPEYSCVDTGLAGVGIQGYFTSNYRLFLFLPRVYLQMFKVIKYNLDTLKFFKLQISLTTHEFFLVKFASYKVFEVSSDRDFHRTYLHDHYC